MKTPNDRRPPRAGRQVATDAVRGWVGDTRTREGFARFIEWVIQRNPHYRADHLVLDQLNTQKSETLARTTARRCALDIDLGAKGNRYPSVDANPRVFLSEPDTPKHASWMNQIEIWFGILARKTVKRGNFSSKEELRDKLIAFIGYFNAIMAQPFK